MENYQYLCVRLGGVGACGEDIGQALPLGEASVWGVTIVTSLGPGLFS